jgi:5-methylcytosine-specific restriction endonuclease McrA
MTSGKCPHPWNKTKKGTFQKGHKNFNTEFKGCWKKGHKLPEWQKEANRLIQVERYQENNHPFKEMNKYAQAMAIKTKWYGIGRAEWKKKSWSIFLRDGCHCRKCHISLTKHQYNVHHIIPYVISNDNSDDNLITLCIRCHAKEEARLRKELSKQIQKSNI